MIQTASLMVIAVLATVWSLYVARSVFLPLVTAWLLSYTVLPLVRRLNRFNIPSGITVTLALTLLGLVALVCASLLVGYVSTFVTAFPEYSDKFFDIVRDLSARFSFSEHFWQGINWSASVRQMMVYLSGSLVGFSSAAVMTIFFLVFSLIGAPYVEVKVRRAFAGPQGDQILSVLSAISRQVSSYLSLMMIISALTGVCVWLALWLLGVNFAGAWGVLAFVLNFIPNIGSIVAFFPPVIVAIVQFFPDPVLPLLTALSLLVIEMVLGNVVTPKVMGDRLDLSPQVILFALLFWGWIWGVMGALLSVPIAVTIKIVCDNVPMLKPLGVMMGTGNIKDGEPLQ